MQFGRSEILTISLMVGVVLLTVFLMWHFGIFSGLKNKSDAPAALSLSAEEGQTYQLLHGETIDLRQYDGKIRVVNSWASWSPFSTKELLDLERIASEYSSQNVVVLAINRKESAYTAEAFLNSLKRVEAVTIVMDPTDKFYTHIGGFSMPETVFYDESGNLIHHQRGEMNYELMKSIVEKIISGQD